MKNGNLDIPQKMVSCGLALAKKRGLEGFTVRQLCAEAKANLGLFHYYFSSREKFNKSVLKELYKELMQDFDLKIPADLPPEEKLKNIGQIINIFTKNNALLLLSILADILSGNKEMLSFVKNNFTNHIAITLSIIEECKKKNIVKNFSSLSLLFFIIAPSAIPNIAAVAVKKVLSKKDYKKVRPFIEAIQSDKYMQERIEISLKGLLK